MFKKIYVEITNNCNLSCPFCIKNHRPTKFMTEEEFVNILSKLKGYTKYLYFHLLGEPLLHPKINEFINLAYKNDFGVNITTNGYLIKRIIDNKNIRQINISLHSFDERYNLTLEEYMQNIFEVISALKETYISLRFWTNSKYAEKMISLINEKYNINLEVNNIVDNTKIMDKVYISTNKEFTWPDLENNLYDENGTCYALKQHIGILVDGTIVPCCLDSKGNINLGNIFNDTLEDIINSKRYQEMKKGFQNNMKVELLCKKCPIKSGIKNTSCV